MGKGKNKNKEKESYSNSTKSGRRGSDSDESMASGLSIDDDMRSVQGEVENLDDVLDQLHENLENAQHKNSTIRKTALINLLHAFTSQYQPEFLQKNKMTITSILSKMDNKTSDECQAMINLMSVIAIQLGEDLHDVIDAPLAQMRTILMDPSRDIRVRKAAALSIAILTRMSCTEDEIVRENVKACQFAWKTWKNEEQNESPEFFDAAISAWCQLLMDADYQTISVAIADQPKILKFLSSEFLEVRIAAGEAISFLYEFMENSRPGFQFPNHEAVLEEIEYLAQEMTKKKTKKEKRVQRFTFREILAFISDESAPPEVKIKFGREVLILDTCSIKMFYDICCGVLYGGIVKQLQYNEVLREVFDLGPIQTEEETKISKSDRLAIHGAADKYRKQIRGKQRDKRSAVI